MASKNQEYAAQYAECAMAQMRRYGIPASVILAQGILESSNGQSRLALAENNHFGIKATPEWIAQGGRYGLYTDDKPNEKFCSYESVGESYEHHSRFLKENGRYTRYFALAPDDYKGWTQGLEQAGYATGGRYADSLQRIIEQNGLQRYDRQVMREMEAQGKRFGVEESPLREAETAAEYAFPVEREEFLFVASPFGMRPDPENGTKQQMHKGIDIRCKDDAALATECGGKVVAVGGNSVTVEYARADGSRVQCTYMHLGDMAVKAGDTVQAGQRLGTAGKDGGHLHFGVRQLSADGTQRDVDPAAYLAEIARKGNLKQQALHDGNDLLARYKGTEESAAGKNLSPDEWMKKLLSSEDSGVGVQRPGGGDGRDGLRLPDAAGGADRRPQRAGAKGGRVGGGGQTENRPETAAAGHEKLRAGHRRKRQGHAAGGQRERPGVARADPRRDEPSVGRAERRYALRGGPADARGGPAELRRPRGDGLAQLRAGHGRTAGTDGEPEKIAVP